MDREQVIRALKDHEHELRAAGVLSLSLIGSVARGEVPAHDVDVVVRLADNFSAPGLDYIVRLDNLEQRLSEILDCKVDVIEEPVRKARFQREIDKDRALAF
jgi:predicted nucleotidyltransferase